MANHTEERRRDGGEPSTKAPSRIGSWGCMAGTVRIMPGTDLTAPTGEPWAAEVGRLTGE